MEIIKSLNVSVDEEINCEITLVFRFTNFELILNSAKLHEVNWGNFISKENYTVVEELTDKYGSHSDNSYVRFKKENDILYIDSDSATGFAFHFNIPFRKVKNEFESLAEWYLKTVNY